jgi:4-amino-4-deoxy-L-arabinose transferase-like glycosyltransferase
MTPDASMSSKPVTKSWRQYWPALWILLILTFVAAERIRLLSAPLERDEGEYAYAGQLMLEGEPPYKLVYNMKMPGIYAAYALMMAVFGQSTTGIRLGFILVNAGAIVLLYFVGRRFLDRVGAVAASAAYALLSVSPHVQGFNAHATHFVVLAALGATLALLRAQERGGVAGFFWSGALFGAAFLMKQPGGAFVLFGFSVMLWTACRRQPPDWKADGLRMAVYAAGVAAPIFLTGLALWRAGVWNNFWWWTVTYARTHATAMPWSDGKIRLANFFTDWSWDDLFWALALAGLCCVALRKGRADRKFFLLSLLFFSAVAVCPAFHFTNHYFVLMLPVVALLAASAFAPAAARLAAHPLALVRGAPWIFFSVAWAGVAWSYLGAFFLWGPQEVAARIYFINDFQVYPVIADYLQSHAPPRATLAIFGSEPELLFEAHRRSVTGYIYMYDLVQEQPFRQRMESQMISEVERGRPDYVVFVNLAFSWLPRPPDRLQAIQEWLLQYTESQYDPCGVVTFGANQFFWGPECLRQVPPGHRFVVIYQRKSRGPDNAKLPQSAS